MMAKRLLIFIAFFFALISKAQNPNAIFDINKPNLVYLESLIKDRLDSIREFHKLKKLHNDSSLYFSVKQHAKFCRNNHKLTYQQESRKYRNPQNRAEANGAENYLVGEVLCMFKLDTNYFYGKLADVIFVRLINDTISKAHILSRMYNIVGLATVVDNNTIFLIIDVAKTGNDYQYWFSKKLFPFDNSGISLHKKLKHIMIKSYAWKIKAPKKEEDFDNDRRTLGRMKKAGVKRDGKRLSVVFDNESSVKQIVKKKKDGFAIEVISFDDYNCLNTDYYKPARRNNHSLLNGKLMKPRYAEDIFKESGYGDDKPKGFLRDIGSIKTDAEIFEANAVAIKKNRIYAVLKPSHICGNEFIYTPEKLPYLDNLYDPNYEPPVTYDTLKLKIYFKVGETEAKSDEIQKIIEFVKKEGLVITKAYVNANASIEGSPKTNKMLFEERATNIISLFETEQDYHIRTIVKTQENWNLFFSQIRNTQFSGLAYKDTAYVRYFVKDSIDYFTEMLDKQRYAQVNLFAVTKATRDQFKVFAINEYKELLPQIIEAKKKNKLKQMNRLIEKAEAIQLFLLDQYNRKKVKLSFVNLLKIPDDDIFVNLKFNRLMFNFKYIAKNLRIDEFRFFNSTKKLSVINNASNLVKYNFVAYLVNHYGEDPGSDYQNSKNFLALIQKAGTEGIDNEYLQKINLHLNYLYTIEYYESLDFKRARNSLSFLLKYYNNQKNISPEILVNLSEYFILFNEFEKAKNIVKPIANCIKPNHKALVLYLKLYYVDYWKEERTEEYYRPLFEATKILSTKDWCSLFVGECNISFQIFDYEPLWKLYCIMNN